MKTLDQIEARTPIQSLPGDSANRYIISQSGSYYLTGNIAGVIGKNAIGVTNGISNVTIDLNGFTLTGINGALTGINAPQVSNLSVSNGTIFNFPLFGINAGVNGATRLERLIISHCAGGGAAAGPFASVRNCTFLVCGSATSPSLLVLNESIVDRCVVQGNPGGDGIQADYNSIVSTCIASENAGSGIVTNGASVRIVGNNCLANLGDGIRGGSFVDISDCTVCLNGSASNAATSGGIRLTSSSGRVDRCFSNNNLGRGIAVDLVNGGNTITRNSSVANTTANYAIASGNRPALIVTYSPATGFTSGDPLANTQ